MGADDPEIAGAERIAQRLEGAEASTQIIERAREAAAARFEAGVREDNAGKPPSPAAGDPPKAKAERLSGGMLNRIVEDLCSAYDFLTDAAGNLYRYDPATGAWRQLSKQVRKSVIFKFVPHLSPTQRADVLENLLSHTTRDRHAWGRVADGEIPCANGILDVETWELRPHEPENYLERALPVDFNPNAAAPLWAETLVTWFGADPADGRLAALQEFFGYICLAHAKYKRAAVLYGETNTGKSVAAMVAKALVGDAYTCQLGVEHMADEQMLVVLKGKALNLLSELSADAMIKDGGFKTLVSTEEPITLNGKYVDQETYTPTAKHLIATNNLPRLNDHTEATFKRLLIIPFTEQIADADQDRHLLDKLKAELEGILLWSAIGARRLVRRHGQWPISKASDAAVGEYRNDSNPLKQFADEMLIPAELSRTPMKAVAEAFVRWNAGGRRSYERKHVTQLLNKALGVDANGARPVRKARYGEQVISILHGYRLGTPAPDALWTTGKFKDGLEVTTGDADFAKAAGPTFSDEDIGA